MSPASGVLHWMARHARQLGIMVRQVEDEIGVINMAIGAAHAGCRAMCATSGGGFALMSEALGAAAMMEIPVVCINVQRAGPATGVPTKTEQGDLWQVLGAGQGDYPRIIVAPTNIADCFKIVPRLFNLVDRFQCPGIILSDLLLSEGRSSIDPAELDFNVPIDRGEVIGLNGDGPPANGAFKRYRITESGISPRALPGTPGYVHVVATDEHDEDGVLISDEFTDPHKRQAMPREADAQDGRGPAPPGAARASWGRRTRAVTLVGWGSTEGVIREAIEQLAAAGHRRQQSPDQVAGPAARRGDRGHPVRRPQDHHRGEQLQRPVRALPESGDRHRRPWSHPQVRRRAVHAAPHRRWRQGHSGRLDHPLRARARDPGLRETVMDTAVETEATARGQPPLKADRAKLTVKDFKGKVDPDWCPGCGDFGVLAALKQAIAELGLQPHEVLTVSGIGCSSNLPGYINTYGMHTLHGRALAVATGAQLANHELKVVVTGGDGDGYGIGGNHFVHSMRRNVDLTYIVMNNQIYGLTTGQLSPTSVKGMQTKSTPFGSVENPINPIPLALAAGATYVARGFTGQQKHLVELIKGGLAAQGLCPHRHLQPLRDVQPRQHVRLLQAADPQAGRDGPRPDRLSRGHGEGPPVGRRHPDRPLLEARGSAGAGPARTGPRATAARWPTVRWASLRTSRGRSSRS